MADVIVVGSYVQDLCFRSKRFPNSGETLIGNFSMGQGGKGFNQAVACHRQDISTLFLGAVGEDAFAVDVEEFAKTEGIQVGLEKVSHAGTGAAAILVDEQGQNQIIVSLGASDYLSKQHLDTFKDEFAQAKVVVTQAECNLEATQHALRLGKEQSALTIFNPAPINELVSAELLSLAQIITPNESEFIHLMRHLFSEELTEDFWKSDDRSLHALCRRFEIPTVVLTLGEHGCFVSHSDASKLARGEFYFRSDAQRVQVMDTTGAGDAFTGGLAAGLVRNPDDFRAAMVYASAVAGLSTTKTGTAPSMPRKHEVEAMLIAT